MTDFAAAGSSTATAYLTDAVLSRDNLIVTTDITITKLVFSDVVTSQGAPPRVVGVEMATSSTAQMYCCGANKEVILCAGTVGTPQLLMLSGLGPADDLENLGITVVKDLPAVGRHVIDVRLRFRLSLASRTAADVCHFIHTAARFVWPDPIPHEAVLDVRLPEGLVRERSGVVEVAAVWDWSALLSVLLVDGVRPIHGPSVRPARVLPASQRHTDWHSRS